MYDHSTTTISEYRVIACDTRSDPYPKCDRAPSVFSQATTRHTSNEARGCSARIENGDTCGFLQVLCAGTDILVGEKLFRVSTQPDREFAQFLSQTID